MHLIDRYKVLLSQIIKIKSISSDLRFKEEIEEASEWYEDLFDEAGFDVDVIEGFSNPVILASYEISDEAETILIYGHYDVQPASQEEWESDPFELIESQGKLLARGVVDNKGQSLIHIVTVLELIKQGKLKYNVKFLIEGGEEIGSPGIREILEKYKSELNCDFIIISDGSVIGNHPVLEVGFRGVVNLQLRLKTADTDLHSGEFGGATPNAAYELSSLLSKLYNEDNQINIEGFYDDVELIEPELAQEHEALGYDRERQFELTGAKEIFTEQGLDFYTQTGLRPAIEITTVSSGYLGDGYRNAIPSVSEAKLNIRIVPHQRIEDVIAKFKAFLEENLPRYVEYELIVPGGSNEAVSLDIDNEYVDQVKDILEDVYQEKLVLHYVGGTLPIVKDFQEVLKVPQLLIPLANESCRMHGVGENFEIAMVEKGFEVSRRLLSL